SQLVFQHDARSDESYFMPSSIGSGAAIFDYDGDGLLDVYLLQNGGPDSGKTNQLFRRTPSGTYENVSDGSGLDVAGFGMGVATGDVTNDGKPDVVVTEYGRTRLLVNRSTDAAPKFEDVSVAAGIDSPQWGTSTCLLDYDRDGWLDIFVVNYVNYDSARRCTDSANRQEFCGPDAFQGTPSRLFHNRGVDSDSGDVRFEDVSAAAGLLKSPGPGLGIFCADFDGDQWIDIFVANDGQPNFLWINQHDGTFKEEAALRGLAYNMVGKSEADMGVAIGDVNQDGLFDIFVTHLATETHTLWVQQPRGSFTDRTTRSGLGSAAWRATGFGTVMADLNNDGSTDLALANGRVTRHSGELPPVLPGTSDFWKDYCERDQLFLNDGAGMLTDASPANDPFCGLASVSRGLAIADLDDDGGLDLLVTRIDGPAALYQNVVPKRGHWLTVKAVEPDSGRDAIGAEVYVRAGEKRWLRWINPGYSFLCSNDARAHFGLGDVERIDGIDVVWPDGSQESFAGGAVDRVIQLQRGQGH
ncbi:MAG: CRTAC1 family protein, partial [Planctomycetales bacterium]|nr:CRTAC1 family protein [Planctomycetales bacterium]